MYISRSLLASAFALSFSTCAEARVAQYALDSDVTELQGKSEHEGWLRGWSMKSIFGKRQADLDCSTPSMYNDILDNAQEKNEKDVQNFCNRWLAIPPATTVVELTPTMTFTTTNRRTDIATSTTRVVTTSTVLQLVSTTPAARVRRVANAAHVAVIERIISSVVSGTTAGAAQNTARSEDMAGLSTACSCQNVDPTSTVTSTFTAPTAFFTVGNNKLHLLTVVTTKIYTAITMVESGVDTAAIASSSVPAARPSGSPIAAANSTGIGASVTAPPSITLMSTGSIAPTAFPNGPPVGPRVPVVVGLPFSCPDAASQNPQFIVGDLRYQYSVLCNKAIVTSDPIDTINVPSETDCASECSLLNHEAHGRVCEAAAFTPVPGGQGGSCLLSGPTQNVIDQPGSTAFFLTGILVGNDNDCGAIEPGQTATNATIAPAALLSSIHSGGYSLSRPGLQTRSETGGVSETYYSSGYTDSRGWYYYTWYKVYASSSAWYEVYATSWSQCANIPRTIVAQLPASSGATGGLVTSIINGTVTTIISGTSTSAIINGGGSVPPTGVLASTTGGGVAFSTAFSTATISSEAGGGSQPPSPAFSVSGAVSTQIFVNGTSAALVSKGIQGTAALTLSEASATTSSEGGFGSLPPPIATAVSVTGSAFVVNSSVLASGFGAFSSSGSISNSSSTANGGLLGPVTASGAAQVTLSSATFTETQIGSQGAIPPAPTNGTAVAALSSASATSNFTMAGGSAGPSPTLDTTSGAAVVVTSSSTLASNYTRGNGGYGPEAVPTAISPTVNSTGPAGTFGAAQWTSSGSIFIAPSTRDAGAQGPAPLIVNSTGLLPTASSGSIVAFVSGSVSASNFKEGESAIPPSPTSGVLATSFNGSVQAGSGVFFTGGVTSLFSAASSIGLIPPPSASVTPAPSLNASLLGSAGTGIFSTASSTAVLLSTGGSNAIPPAAVNISETVSASLPTLSLNTSVPAGTAIFSTSGVAAITSIAGSSGAIPPPSANVSVTASASITPSASFNGTVSSVTQAASTSEEEEDSGFHAVSIPEEESESTAASESGFITPSLNATAPAPSATLVPSVNASTTLAGTAPASSGFQNFSTSTGTSVTLSTGATGAIGPIANLTPTASASIIPSPSLNASTTTGATFSNNDSPRTGGPRNSTAPIGTGTAAAVFINATTLLSTSVSSSVRVWGGYGPPPWAIVTSSTSIVVTTVQPSITVAPVSANSSLPIASTSEGSFSNDDDDRRRRSRSSTLPTGSSAAPVPLSNTTLASSGIPSVPANATQVPVGTASSSVPAPPVNYTAPIGTASASLSFVPTTANSTYAAVTALPSGIAPLITGSSGAPQPSENSSSPSGTASSALPQLSVNTTVILATGTGPLASIPAIPVNSTSVAGSASAELPTSSANVSVPLFTAASASFSISSATANATSTSGTGVASASPTPSINITVPLSTGTTASVVISIISLNSSEAVGTASSAIPVPSINSTGLSPTVTPAPSSSVPTASSNISLPVGTGSSAVPVPSNNSTGIYSTGTGSLIGTASSAIPVPSSNSTGIFSTGTKSPLASTAIPSAANSTAFLPTGTASSSFLAPPANFTNIFNTYSESKPSSAVAPVLANSTGVFPTGTNAIGTAAPSSFPTPLTNGTIPPSLQTSPPSATPIFSSNSTAEACPTAVSFSLIPHVQVITTTSFETVPIGPSSCLSTASIAPSLSANGTLPTLPTETGPASDVLPLATSTPTPTLAPDLALPGTINYRRSGEIATEEQINYACSLTDLVLNPNFAIHNPTNDAALGWSTTSTDPTVRFLTIHSTNASVLVAAPGRSLTTSQPLTLCPGKKYKLTSFNRVPNLMAKCTVEYLIGNASVYVATPGENASKKEGFFTAGVTPEEVSKDLSIRAKCDGEGGAVVGADADGWMVVEFGGVSVTVEA